MKKRHLLMLVFSVALCHITTFADDDTDSSKGKKFYIACTLTVELSPVKDVPSALISLRLVNSGDEPIVVATSDAKWWNFVKLKAAKLVEEEKVPPGVEVVTTKDEEYKLYEVPEGVFEFELLKIFPQQNLENITIYPFPFRSREHSDFVEVTWLVKTPNPSQLEDGDYSFKAEFDWNLVEQLLPDLAKENFVDEDLGCYTIYVMRFGEWSFPVNYKESPSTLYSQDLLVRLMRHFDDDIVSPRLYQEILRINPNSSRARVALACAYYYAGDYDRYLQLMQEALHIVETHQDPTIPEDSELGKKEFYDGIRVDFCYSWELYGALCNLAEAYGDIGEYQKAIDTYLEAIDVLRTSPVIGEGEIPNRLRWEIEAKIKELKEKLTP